MMINIDQYLELGFPEPKFCRTQQTYVKQFQTLGRRVSTRQCQFLGIAYLPDLRCAFNDSSLVFVTTDVCREYPSPPLTMIPINVTTRQINEPKKTKPEPTTNK
jgi:hypothetical protein